MKETLKLKGHYDIEIREHGKLVKTISLDNVLTELYRQAVMDSLMQGTSIEVKYFAVGTDDTPATANDTKLGTEVFRSVPTYQEKTTAGLVTTWVLTAEQANYYLKEIGVFIGTTASITPDTGIMMSRINIDIQKTSAVEITFRRTDYIMI